MDYPIIMADIINSRLKDSNELMKEFRLIVSAVNEKHKQHLLSPLTITLGDEFQGIIESMEKGIQIIFDLEEKILELNVDLKLRYVLLFGKIDTKINPILAHEMLGEGLTNSRKILGELKKENTRFLVVSKLTENPSHELINKAFSIYQSIIDSWKSKDKKTVVAFLNLDDYKLVAQKTSIDKSSAWRRRKSLKIDDYLNIKSIIGYLLSQ